MVRTQSLALVILFGVAGIANAAGLREYNDDSLDASADGNNLTADDNTGLEWLDIDVHFNKTLYGEVTTVLARPAYAAFSVATTPQVAALFDAFDITGISGIRTDGYAVVPTPLSKWTAATDLVGFAPMHIGEGINGWAFDPVGNANYVASLQYQASLTMLFVGGTASFDGTGWDPVENSAHEGLGTWLVRPHVIPEPSTFCMLAFCGIAMAGYSRHRRRRK